LRGTAGPGALAEVAEVALGEEVNLDVLDDDARVVDWGGDFEAPEFFAVFVGDGDGFAFPGVETAGGAGSFDEDGEPLVAGGSFGVFISRLALATVCGSGRRRWPRAAGHR
jgi:hypothetical protein